MINNQLEEIRTEEPRSTSDLLTSGRMVPEDKKRLDPDNNSRHEPLFPDSESQDFRTRWHEIQGTFVDEPRRSVEQADQLVATVVQKLAESFASERNNLEGLWSKGEDVSTEDLRQALRRYRSFFDRLLSA